MFLCSSLKLQNLGVFFEGLYLVIFVPAACTLIWQNENLIYRSTHINGHL